MKKRLLNEIPITIKSTLSGPGKNSTRKELYIMIRVLFIFILLLTVAKAKSQHIGILTRDTTNIVADGHRMRLYISGEGSPAVIMEAGLGANHRCWRAVDTTLARITTVVTYDRPGYPDSDSCKQTRDAHTIATELKEALIKSGVNPPYILVGWSLGGVFIREYAKDYPEDVSGIVLVDPATSNFYKRIDKEYPELLADDSAFVKEVYASNRTGEKAELRVFDQSMEQSAAEDSVESGIRTILLVSAYGKAVGAEEKNPSNPLNRVWTEEQKKWAEKRSNTEFRLIADSGHHIAKEKPEEVVAAVTALLNTVYKSR